MNVIFLSGGSGKRLWPLSNETRSKQFLKLLKTEKRNYESMVQRVYRQMKEAGISAEHGDKIVITTGTAQVDAIRSQLGNQVSLVTEPERRDTFPAIALACAYLGYTQNISEDEPVVVLPVDPYADSAYFEVLKAMEQAVKREEADLILMGIRPTYPSAKYGYMILEENDKEEYIETTENIQSSLVSHFREKPEENEARELIQQGAYWNGGVFAFRLGYILSMVRDYRIGNTFESVRKGFSNFPKTSFDYAVAEKAKQIRMLPYEGYWRDLGTWNTLTKEMEERTVGNVITGEHTRNTHIINELSIPVVALGTNNLIIAASPDGILVSDKQKSSYLKPYVDQLENRPMYEERRWGEYKVLDYIQYADGIKSLTKHLTILAGQEISYQRHLLRDEIWTVVDGTGKLLLDGQVRDVKRGDMAYIMKGKQHAMRAVTDLHFIEVQIGEELVEEDIERVEWVW